MRRYLEVLPVTLLVIVITGIWATYPYWVSSVFGHPQDLRDVGEIGTFGDAFGALNTLFSGLAFFGIIVSILLQSKELTETRNEIKAQGEQFKLQTGVLHKQVFENTFFQLLQLHNEIVHAVSVNYKKQGGDYEVDATTSGRPAFRVLYIHKFIEGEYWGELEHTPVTIPDDAAERYSLFHEVYGSQIGHYFRNIYQVLKFIENSSVENKKFYSNLLRAQLSSYELALLFYNCLSPVGVDEFKPLVEKYEFFEHLPELRGMESEYVRRFAIEAFGKTNDSFLHKFEGGYIVPPRNSVF